MNKRSHLLYLIAIAALALAWYLDRQPQTMGSEQTLPTQGINISQPIDKQGFDQKTPPKIMGSEAKVKADTTEFAQHVGSEAITQETTTKASATDLATLTQQQVTHFATDFYEQDYDTAWSYTAEQQLNDLFVLYAHELENFTLLQVACKSTLCQIKTNISGNHFAQFMQLQKTLLEQSWYGPNSKITMTTNDEGEPYEIYLSLE